MIGLVLRRTPCAARPATARSGGGEVSKMATSTMREAVTQRRRRRRRVRVFDSIVRSASLGGRSGTTSTSTTTSSLVSSSMSEEEFERMRAYNLEMEEKMGWRASGLDPFQYHPERGLYLHEVAPGLLCGTQPRNRDEVEVLQREHGVTHIVCLQRDEDAAHWGVDLRGVARDAERRGIRHARAEARDFDPQSLRKALPAAVRLIDEGLRSGTDDASSASPPPPSSSPPSSSSPSSSQSQSQSQSQNTKNRIYVHCTAGLGRAPAACIAWLKWFGGLDLDSAIRQVTSIRPCGPKRDAVRGASFDLAHLPGVTPPFEHLPEHAFSDLSAEERRTVQERVRGGWGGWEV